jgi:ribosomal protein S18 acetylase RimI-like enzyme
MRGLTTTIRPATTWEDALAIRKIRNSLREFMTRDQEPKTVTQQRVWWAKTQRNRSTRLLVMENDKDVIGYGVLRYQTKLQWDGDHDRSLLTGAVITPYQGLGYGRMIFSHLVCESYIHKHTPWLEVFPTNARAQLLYKQLGFVETQRTDDLITMKHKR